ncbi:MAG: dipeptide ABC transporter ATP-binding protein [Saprospiraceae bacterium]
MASLPTDIKPLIAVQGLRVFFQGAGSRDEVLRGIDLAIYPGETLGIVGESGCGKTLTALALGGLLPPAAGVSCQSFSWQLETGALDLKNFRQESFARLRGNELAYIFQDPGAALNPVLTCGAQIEETLAHHAGCRGKAARKMALEWLDRVGLPEPERIFRAYPHEVSGGQKQRVMIASALCAGPRLLIADEPTTSLDTTVQRHILDLLKDLKRALGLSALFISHDLGIIGEMADRVLVMQEGSVVEQKPVRQLFYAPEHPYTRALLACRPSLPKVLEALPSLIDSEAGRQTAVGSTLLQAEGLSAGFRVRPRSIFGKADWLQAVDGVSFDLHAGETLGVVGESGSGKSTLARVLLGLVPAQTGKITFEGKEMTGVGPAEWQQLRKGLQLVFQDPFTALNPRQRVGEALIEPLRVHQRDVDRHIHEEMVFDLMKKVGLSDKYLDRYPHELSGGQRQRVGIARALALRPRVLVCDEPVTALDVSVQAMVLDLLKSLQQELGLAYLFISHDLATVAFMSQRIMVMKNGKIIESGSTRNTLVHPVQPYTRELLKAVPGGFLAT